MSTPTQQDWQAYVREQGETFGVSFHAAWTLFQMLGPEEAYDGFIVELEDYAADSELYFE